MLMRTPTADSGTGEHGVKAEKKEFMTNLAKAVDEEDKATMDLFGLMNPGK